MAVFTDPDLLAEHIQTLWQERIPLAGFIDARIEILDESGLTVRAPLGKNCNHMGTAFAGSLQSLATLTAWGIAVALSGDCPDRHVVIQSSSMNFLKPVTGDFTAFCPVPESTVADKFCRQLDRKGRARISLGADVRQKDKLVATFSGDFVAFRQG